MDAATDFCGYQALVEGLSRQGSCVCTVKKDLGSSSFTYPEPGFGEYEATLEGVVLKIEESDEETESTPLKWLENYMKDAREYWSMRMVTDGPDTMIDVRDGMDQEHRYHSPKPTFVVNHRRFRVEKSRFLAKYWSWNGTKEGLETYRALEAAEEAAEKRKARERRKRSKVAL